MKQITLEAPDISCEHCIMTIEKTVARFEGARFVSGDPQSKTVVVEYDPDRVELSVIEEALEEEGYPVTG